MWTMLLKGIKRIGGGSPHPNPYAFFIFKNYE